MYGSEVMAKTSETKFIKGETTPQKMMPKQLAYMAGIIDGCGTLTVDREGKPLLTIEKISDLAKQIALRFGGSLRYRKPDKKHDYYRYNWFVKGKTLKELLTKVKPLLISNKKLIETDLLLKAFEIGDPEMLNEIKKQLIKNQLNMKLKELAEKDGSWFESYKA